MNLHERAIFAIANLLERDGFWVLDYNAQVRGGRIDIVASKGSDVHFFDVILLAAGLQAENLGNPNKRDLKARKAIASEYMDDKGIVGFPHFDEAIIAPTEENTAIVKLAFDVSADGDVGLDSDAKLLAEVRRMLSRRERVPLGGITVSDGVWFGQ